MADAPHDGYYYDADGYPYSRRGVNTVLIILIGVFAVMSMYLFLVVGTKLQPVLFPGRSPLPASFAGVKLPGAEQPEEAPTVVKIEDRINILFLGLDQRLDEADDEPYRTDSVVIFTIDPFTNTAGAFSIPRDTWVDVPNADGTGVYTSTRINEVYEYGEYIYRYDFPDGGVDLVKKTLEYNFNIPIEHYIIMNWTSFIDIVDQLDGIDVNVPEYAYDPAYSTCSFCGEYYPVEFVPGVEHMDGERALEYARIRKSDNDFKRVERQQIVMRAIAEKATSLNLLDVGKAKDLYGTYKDAIRTDVSNVQIPGLALLAQDVGLSNVNMVSAAPALYSCESIGDCPGGASVQYINMDVWNELQASVFSDSRVGSEAADIDILNGTLTPGLAGVFADEAALGGISRLRLHVDEYANNLVYPATVIIDVNGSAPTTLATLKEKLNLPDSRILTAADPDAQQFLGSTSDIIVVLGEDATLDYAGTTVTVTPDAGG